MPPRKYYPPYFCSDCGQESAISLSKGRCGLCANKARHNRIVGYVSQTVCKYCLRQTKLGHDVCSVCKSKVLKSHYLSTQRKAYAEDKKQRMLTLELLLPRFTLSETNLKIASLYVDGFKRGEIAKSIGVSPQRISYITTRLDSYVDSYLLGKEEAKNG